MSFFRRTFSPPIFFFLTVLMLMVPRVCYAILDIEALRMKLRDQPYGGVVEISYDRREGNTDTNRLSLTAQGLWKVNRTEYLATAERSFGESSGVTDTDRSVGHLRATWPAPAGSALESYAQIERDAFRRLSDRELYGFGARERLFNEKTFIMYLGAGPMWSRETLLPAPDTTDAGNSSVLFANLYDSLRYEMAQNIAFNFVTYYQPSLAALSNLRLLNDSTLEFDINKLLAISLVFQLIYESRPAQQVLPGRSTFRHGFDL